MIAFINQYKKTLTKVLLVAVIINILVIRVFDAPLKNEICKKGITSFELAKDLNKTTAILNSWDTNAKINMSLSLGFDFLFLTLYSSLIALLIYSINNRLWKNKPFHKIGKLLIYLIFIAAFFDIIENIALIKILLGNSNQFLVSVAYYFASIKFLIVLLCLVYLIINWLILLFQKKTN